MYESTKHHVAQCESEKGEGVVYHQLYPYRRIWIAKIWQYIVDLKSHSNKEEKTLHRRRAKEWFEQKDTDYWLSCEYAGLDPLKLAKQAMLIIRQQKQAGFIT